MNTILTDILIFKTNIQEADIPAIAVVLNAESRITRWSVDCGDVDCVLRIEAQRITTADVIRLVRKAGFHCEELPD
jgi:hypothetical protein